jgi:hypothetical protein
MKVWMSNFLFILMTIIIHSHPLHAQSNSTDNEFPMPKFMILPWETPNIDDDAKQRSVTARNEITLQLKKIFSPNAVSLDSIAPKVQTIESARHTLTTVLADSNATFSSPLAILPLWTRIHNYDLFAIVVIDIQRNTIRSVVHRLVPRVGTQKSLQTRSYQGFFSQAFSELSNSMNLASLPAQNDDLAVAIRDQTANTRSDEIDRATLSVLILGQWPADFLALNPYANELISTIHRFYGRQSFMRKANREVVAHITYEKPPSNLQLPVSLTLNIRAVESVFAQTLPWKWSEPLVLGVKGDNTIDLKFSDRLKTELTSERAALRRDELPKVAKIRGAWAYVDKGRAWGLQMNDRLISEDEPQKIKGHVVAYFGPELNLKSVRGWPINEGAIIFIRKGQQDVRLGQSLMYDGMKVPTPWPPAAPANK